MDFSEEQLTRAAKQLWENTYAEPWPDGLVVKWNRRLTRQWGNTTIRWSVQRLIGRRDLRYSPRAIKIELSYKLLVSDCDAWHGKRYTVFEVLWHEFTHVRKPAMRHGWMFNLMVEAAALKFHMRREIQAHADKIAALQR